MPEAHDSSSWRVVVVSSTLKHNDMLDLFKKYLDNECSPAEVKELLAYFNVPENEQLLKGLIMKTLEIVDADSDEAKWRKLARESYPLIKEQIHAEKIIRIPLVRKTWFRVAAAAALLLGVFAVYNLLNKSGKPETGLVKTNNVQQEIGPGSNKAVLTLADGSTIILENAGNGELAQQGDTKIVKLENGQLAYNSLKDPSTSLRTTEILFNSIRTPRGGEYQLTLSDGSTVWLNAGSSLRFPVAFAGRERRVEITGEAYFEVAKNASMPFKVNVAGKGEVEVLGTHFNINSYSDEATINTTLLEGSVKVTGITTGASRVISPGEQAQLNTNGQISLNKKVDTEQVIAWKKGVFNFTNSSVETILRQLSRWFDVDVVYEGAIPQREFTGEIEKKLNLSQVLTILEKNNLRFRLEGRKLVVMP